MITKQDVPSGKPDLSPYFAPFSDAELLGWLESYRERIVPAAEAERHDDPDHFHRSAAMLAGLVDEAHKRGLDA